MADGDAPVLFLSIALLGNRMDPSLWPADDTPAVVALLDDTPAARPRRPTALIDLAVDNAGFELCTDLLLADHLLSSRDATCPSVTLALAARPRSYPFSSHTNNK